MKRLIKMFSSNQSGFTLLEVVVVMTIMGFLVSMTVPAIGHISNTQRSKATEQKLEEIKVAIVGSQDVFDENGLQVVNGYVGDMGELPKLYDSEIDQATRTWKWSHAVDVTINNLLWDDEKKQEVLPEGEIKKEIELKQIDLIQENNNGRGQPRGLWMNNWGIKRDDLIKYIKDTYPLEIANWTEVDFVRAVDKIWHYENLGAKWKGPYISEPKAMYPEATENLDPIKDKELYENRETKGKAIDAWGRNLYFFKEYEVLDDESTATMLIVSQGKDEEISLPDLDDSKRNTYSDVADEDANKDNIVVKITPNEWHEAYNKGKEKKTKQQLETIREALVGSLKAVDKSGERKIGGYLGDMGEWPGLYKLEESGWRETIDGQPSELWTTQPKEKILDKENNKLKEILKSEKPTWEFDESIKKELKLLDEKNEKLKSKWKRKWKGPYITEPWGDVLLDSWGARLKFEIIKKKDKDGNESDSMIVRSAGVDGAFNTEDDLIISIDLDEWANEDVIIENGKEIKTTKNDAKKLRDTKNTLEEIRVALLGSKDARDGSGRRIMGGYLSDVGEWPNIEGFNSKNGWVSIPDGKAGQPRGLWSGSTSNSNGFGWRGPYISNAENKPLVDAWGEFIRFRLSKDKRSMTITSAGIDGKFNSTEDRSDDDIIITINKDDWMADRVVIKGTIYNNGEPIITIYDHDNGQSSSGASGSDKTVKLELDSSPNDSKYNDVNVPNIKIKTTPIKTKRIGNDGNEYVEIIGHDNTISGAGKANFTLEAENVVLGQRKLRLTGTGINEEIELFIGTGGTISPSSDKLIFTID